MAQVEFNNKGIITTFWCNRNEIMEDICRRFTIFTLIDSKNVYFFYSGKQINQKLTYNEIINDVDKQRNKMSIFVYEINNDDINDSITKSVYPICPICKESVKLEIKDYKINLSECKNKHDMNIIIDEYESNIDLKLIECSICKKSKYDTYNNLMYKCNGCNKILCPTCKEFHDKNHNVINYDIRNSICNNHSEIYKQ